MGQRKNSKEKGEKKKILEKNKKGKTKLFLTNKTISGRNFWKKNLIPYL